LLPEKEIRPLKDFKRARLRVPSSKSLTQRALICSALADGKSRIINPLLSEDPRLLLSALEGNRG
jgi:3-phosphoshikimate 1-carboxyvinyltransferase